MTNYSRVEFATAMLNLFKALPCVDELTEAVYLNDTTKMKFIRKGLVLSDKVMHLEMLRSEEVRYAIIREMGSSTAKFNNTFFENIDKISSMKDEEFYLHQILNYITFNLADWGLIDNNEIYVPNEKIGVSEDVPPYHLTVVQTMTKEETKERIEKLLYTGVALKEDTVSKIFTVSDCFGFTDELDADKVKNKEAQLTLYKRTNTVPKNPDFFVRYLYYLATGSTMLVKSKRTYRALKERLSYGLVSNDIAGALRKYVSKYGCETLAKAFYRNKKLLLLFKNEETAYIINRTRRLADTYKKAPKVGVLDRLSELTMEDWDDFVAEVAKLNVFKKVALINYIMNQHSGNTDSLYFIRNGRVFFRENYSGGKPSMRFLRHLIESVVEEMSPVVAGKKFYIPQGIEYAFPVSEKKFVGGIPFNSKFTLERKGDVLFGIHWYNYDDGTEHGKRTDLDLHITSVYGERMGWNSFYRDGRRSTYFTGDMTDAPRNEGGAAELMYFMKDAKPNMYSVTVNNFTNDHYPFPFSLIVSNAVNYADDDKSVTEMCKDAFVNNTCDYMTVNNYLKSANNTMGYFILNEDTAEFVFTDMQVGNCVVPNSTDFDTKMMKYISTYSDTVVKLKDVLEWCKAEIVDEPVEGCVNLDYRELGETTILDAFCKKD